MEHTVSLQQAYAVYSLQSGRQIGRIELLDLTDDQQVTIDQPLQFVIRDGFGALWQKSFANQPIFIRLDDTHDALIAIAAFPVDRDGVGYIKVGSVVPHTESAPAQPPETAPDSETTLTTRFRRLFGLG